MPEIENTRSTKIHYGIDGRRYRYTDLLGLKFGKWVVIGRGSRVYSGRSIYFWKCKCKCGNIKLLGTTCLLKGHSKQCSKCYGKRQRIPAYSQVWAGIVQHANDRGIEITITREEAFALLETQKGKCALTDLPIQIAKSRRSHDVDRKTTASLDRKDSDKGYTIDNVWWVHKKINIMKHTLSITDFVKVCRLVVNKVNKGEIDEGNPSISELF